MNRLYPFTLALIVLCMTTVAHAVPIDPNLSGNTSYDGWESLTGTTFPGYGTFPGTATWPAPIGSNMSGAGDATLMKTRNGPSFGGPYLSGAGIYFGGFSADPNLDGGSLEVTDNTPLADLSTVVFQIEIGEAFTYDFYNEVLPTFSYNGGSQVLAATNWSLVDQVSNGTVSMPTGPNGTFQDEELFLNTYMLEWDVTALSSPITDFSIQWTGVQHAQITSLRLDQTDFIQPAGPVVGTPEPASLGLVAVGAAMLLTFRRRASLTR